MTVQKSATLQDWKVVRVVGARPRLSIGVLAGLAAGIVAPHSLAPLTRFILAWDLGCLVFLVLTAHMFSVEREGTMAGDAARQEEGEWTIFWLTVGATIVSFAAIIGEFSKTKDLAGTVRWLHVGLMTVTLLVSWLVTHVAFALRYAHEYYETADGTAEISRGLEFPGERQPDYWDFVYFALVLGMTFQVSDVQITSRQLRRLAAAHGLLSFLFNTVIIALTVNIGASML
jgi:uncharacterized membrane protein